MNHNFQIVDVFGDSSFTGNPLAVVAHSGDLSVELMLQITRWLNFSETAFLLPPSNAEADYRVRIFSLGGELPFAGHPTLGSCHAWLGGGGVPRRATSLVQECGAGLIQLKQEGSLLFFAAPPLLRSGPVEEAVLHEVAQTLHLDRSIILDAQWADNGPGWLVILLESADAVLAVEPARHCTKQLDAGIVGPYSPDHETAFELRAFFTDYHGTLREDPVTGSLNASTAQWLINTGRATAPYVVAQGSKVGCSGRVYIREDKAGQVWVGGKTQTHFSGVCTV